VLTTKQADLLQNFLFIL